MKDALGESKAKSWYDNFVTSSFTFLGQRMNGSIHISLAKHLKKVESQLVAQSALPAPTAESVGQSLGLESGGLFEGGRAYPTAAPVSMHLFGLALDLRVSANFYYKDDSVRKGDWDNKTQSYTREGINHMLARAYEIDTGKVPPTKAGQLDLPDPYKWPTFESGFAANKEKSGTAGTAWDQIEAMDTALSGYLQLAEVNGTAKTALEQAIRKADPGTTFHGKSVDEARAIIQNDLDALVYLSGKLHKQKGQKTWEEAKAGQPDKFGRIAGALQSTGVLDLSKDLVVAMGLKWGASYGDMMHFDMRNQGGDAEKIRNEIEKFKKDRDGQRKLHEAHVARTQPSPASPESASHDDG